MRKLTEAGHKHIYDSLFPFFGKEADYKISLLRSEIESAVATPGKPIIFQDGQFSDHAIMLKPEHTEEEESEHHEPAKHGKYAHEREPGEDDDDEDEGPKDDEDDEPKSKAKKAKTPAHSK